MNDAISPQSLITAVGVFQVPLVVLLINVRLFFLIMV